MHFNFKPLIKSFLILLILVTTVMGQGAIKGVVTDSLTSETLIGANVFIMGTGFGAATDFEGEYRINGIPAGDYTLIVSYIGYISKEYPVKIEQNKTLQLDAELALDVVLSDEVVITAQAAGQVAAINQQLNSNTIVNIVSEEKIQELPDANAAESVGRLPGVSLLRSGGEANKIILRGMSDKYTSVTLDGVKIPSTDAEERGIDLSAISQSSLAGIELYKALTSDKDADAIAGSVNLVTKKAPKKQEIRVQLNGGYNDVMASFRQYDLSAKYGERFFNGALGLQVNGNIENKIRSNERININYTQTGANLSDYFVNNLTVLFTDEIRTRNGASIILDFNTPDDGNIKFNNTFNGTKRDYLTSQRDFPNGGGTSQTGGVTYQYRDREQEIQTFTSSLTGDNRLFGFGINWGLSFAQSISDFPYDYQLDFTEPSFAGESGMGNPPGGIKDHPEQLIDYAYNNFLAATLSQGFKRTQHNVDKDKSLHLNVTKEYSFMKNLSGSLKFGAKYKEKTRTNNNTYKYAPYYLGYWQPYENVPGEGIRPKDLSGTYFDAFFQRYQDNHLNNTVSFQEFLDDPIQSKDIFAGYPLNPLINRDKLRQWYDLNQYGVSQSGGVLEYYDDPSFEAQYYNISEAVAAAYIMNTLKLGQSFVFIAGVRVEHENNNYKNKYSESRFSGFPVPIATTRDTTANYSETIVLPNFHLNIKATDWMNIRMAAYKALARPDFNMRLNTYFAWRPAAVGSGKQLIVGNPKLKTAKAWNYEINTSFYGNEIGLITVSAFYKEIVDMYHMLNQINTSGNVLFEKLGLDTQTLHDGTYQLTIPYNSPQKSKVWGFEFEHQINFTWLPGVLQNLVLSYNVSYVKSETSLIGSTTDTTYSIVNVGGIPLQLPSYSERAIEYKQQLENQPELFGNISLGYDYEGVSVRISLFHQSQYNLTFSPNGWSDRIISPFTRLDLVVKYQYNENLSFHANISNLTNIKENNELNNTFIGYKVLRSSEFYGLTADFGVRIDL